ncbi:MAG: tRNA pseudouridine(55) synthase TruB [Roseococcus sp.]|nr:tRNA pseudouridine(55) synthase TruB [Roseococcus sp.]
MPITRTGTLRRPVHGVLLLDKPLGLSSNQALQKARWLLRAEKGGHTGTLDPLATGVLPLCFGAATKFSQIHIDADKTYEAVLRLGIRTATGDAEGEVIDRRPVPAIHDAMLAEVAARFTGAQTQVPPMHSALKHEGRALYAYARAGETVDRQPRNVWIHELNLALTRTESGASAINLIAKVSKGTYIRTLGEDIGEALGCGAHLASLRRLSSGRFHAADGITLDALAAMDEPERLGRLLPVDSLLAGHEAITLDGDDAARFLSGMRRRGDWPDADAVIVRGPDGALLGTARVRAGELIAERLLNPEEIRNIRESQP